MCSHLSGSRKPGVRQARRWYGRCTVWNTERLIKLGALNEKISSCRVRIPRLWYQALILMGMNVKRFPECLDWETSCLSKPITYLCLIRAGGHTMYAYLLRRIYDSITHRHKLGDGGFTPQETVIVNKPIRIIGESSQVRPNRPTRGNRPGLFYPVHGIIQTTS